MTKSREAAKLYESEGFFQSYSVSIGQIFVNLQMRYLPQDTRQAYWNYNSRSLLSRMAESAVTKNKRTGYNLTPCSKTRKTGVYFLPPPQRILRFREDNKKFSNGMVDQRKHKLKRLYEVNFLFYCTFFPFFHSVPFHFIPFPSLTSSFYEGKIIKAQVRDGKKSKVLEEYTPLIDSHRQT